MNDIPQPAKKLKQKRPEPQFFSSKEGQGWWQISKEPVTTADEYPYVLIKEPGKEPVVYFSKRSFGKKDTVSAQQSASGHEGIFQKHNIMNPFCIYTEEQRAQFRQQGFREIAPQYVEIGILKQIKNKILTDAPDKIIILTSRMRKVDTDNCTTKQKDKKFIKDCWKRLYGPKSTLFQSNKGNSR